MALGSLTGDSGKLAALIRGLERFGDSGYQQVVAVAAGRAAQLVERGFAAGTSPDGAPWAPTKAGNTPPLTRTGALRDQASRVRATSRGLRVRSSLPYASFHQTGTTRMPARPYLPSTDAGALPPVWRRMIEASVETVLRVYLPA